MGMTHGNANTFPYLAKPICYVPAGDGGRRGRGGGQAVPRPRQPRRPQARPHQVPRPRLGRRASSARCWPATSAARSTLPRPVEVSGFDLHLGWHPQGDGKWYYGLSVENGRVKDEGTLRLRSGLRAIVERFQPGDAPDAAAGHAAVRPRRQRPAGARSRCCAEHGIPPPEQRVARAAAQHGLPGDPDVRPGHLRVGAGAAGHHRRAGSGAEASWAWRTRRSSVRMTGCPNGCVRPYQSDIGIVGRSGDKYIALRRRPRPGPPAELRAAATWCRAARSCRLLRPLLEHFKDERRPGESFGDYCHRLGQERCQGLLRDYQI